MTKLISKPDVDNTVHVMRKLASDPLYKKSFTPEQRKQLNDLATKIQIVASPPGEVK